MTCKKFLMAFICLFFFSHISFAEGDGKLTRSEYIEMWKDEAIYQMAVHHIPASITLAQGMLESGNGNSTLAKKANNHFGIKCHSNWDGDKVFHDDDAKGECFRKYPNAGQSYEDHSIFLKQKRYLGLYELDVDDYKSWAKGLKKAGYATDPKYAIRLIDIIEENDLKKYDKEGIKLIKSGKTPFRPDFKGKDEELLVIDDDRPNLKGDGSKSSLPEISISSNRGVILSPNRIPYIIASEGDSFESIANDLELMSWQIWKYNDLSKTDKISEGQKIYIKPKRARAKTEFHIVTEGESLWDISQIHGVKLKKLCARNKINPESALTPGMKLALK